MKSPARSSSSLPGPTITFSGRDPSCSNLKLEIKICFHSTIKDMLVQRGLKQLACTISQSAHPMAGRLKHLLPNWAQVTQDQWVLNTVQGYSIDFMGVPIQETRPRMGISSVSEQSLIQEEIQKMLLKGAIIELSQTEAAQGFFSSLFLVPKKDGGMRPVINLKQLNKFIPPHQLRIQDGGNAYREGSVEEGRLVDKGGSEGCVFHHPNPQEGQAVPQVLSPESSLSIHMPAVRPLVRSLGLYQDP